ncbi:MAG: arginase family protein [Candidatus Diapherotrites archaeon]|nr:arginase family protein [Candidatus Diapherotrites archaeon]
MELYLDRSRIIKHSGAKLEDAKVAILGIPFDSTSTEFPGSRFGPNYVRDWFSRLYGYDNEEEQNVYDTKFYDAGNHEVYTHFNKTEEIVTETIKKMYEKKDIIPIALGGEHSITHMNVKAVASHKNFALVVFDAHADLLFDENEGVTHISFLQDITKESYAEKIIVVGVRAYTPEEKAYANDNGITLISAELVNKNVSNVINFIMKEIANSENVYISVDIDVLDPIYSIGTGSPEPEGIDFISLKEIIKSISNDKVIVGGDINEVLPERDPGQTGVYAAHLLKKMIIWSNRI